MRSSHDPLRLHCCCTCMCQAHFGRLLSLHVDACKGSFCHIGAQARSCASRCCAARAATSASTIRPAGMRSSGSTRRTILHSASRRAGISSHLLPNQALAPIFVVQRHSGLRNEKATHSTAGCACQHLRMPGCLCVFKCPGVRPWLRQGTEKLGQADLLDTEHAHVKSEGAVHVGCRARRPWRA